MVVFDSTLFVFFVEFDVWSLVLKYVVDRFIWPTHNTQFEGCSLFSNLLMLFLFIILQILINFTIT